MSLKLLILLFLFSICLNFFELQIKVLDGETVFSSKTLKFLHNFLIKIYISLTESTKSSETLSLMTWKSSRRWAWVVLDVLNLFRSKMIHRDRLPWSRWKKRKLLRRDSSSTSCPKRKSWEKLIVISSLNYLRLSKTESTCTCWWKVVLAVSFGRFCVIVDTLMMQRHVSIPLVLSRLLTICTRETSSTGLIFI